MEEAGRDEEHAAFVQEFEFMTGRPWPRNSRLLVQSEKNAACSCGQLAGFGGSILVYITFHAKRNLTRQT